MVCLRNILVGFAWMAAVLAGGRPVSAEPSDYRLGPQDHLQIKVYDWRSATGGAYEWTALNGEFTVGASGAVSLPLLGEVPAYNTTPADLAVAIAERLQKKIGLAQRPDPSVQVIKYRPFYIMGSVEKPGDYEFQPGLTVLQAVSMAGGLMRLSDNSLLGYEREALSGRGELRVLTMERLGLLARQARLDAEIKDEASVTFPEALTSRAGDADIARTMREEDLLFDARRNALKSQTDALMQTKALLQREVASLGEKDASLAQQLDIVKKELDMVSGLVSKGLAVLPRQLAVQQNSAQFESSRLDVQLATLRAQQDISKTDRDALELRNKRRGDALTESSEVHARLVAASEKLDTAQSLVYQAEVRAPLTVLANTAGQRSPVYTLTRRVEGVVQTAVAQENDSVQPGDTIQVELGQGRSTINAADRTHGTTSTVLGQVNTGAVSGF